MKILGVDPGTATVGFGLINLEGQKTSLVEYGVIKTSKTHTDSKRLESIAEQLSAIIKKHKPKIIVVEKLFFSKNVKTALSVAQSRGVILFIAETHKLKIVECSPQEVKMSVTGYGKSDKKQVQIMVKRLLNLKDLPKPDDAADAIAAALFVVGRVRLI